jgi:hypothetical protein
MFFYMNQYSSGEILVLMVVSMKMAVFQDIVLCSLIETD